MPAIARNPVSINLAAPNKFSFNLTRAPALSYFCQKVKLPDVRASAVNIPTPSSRVPTFSDHVVYSPLVLTFKIDINFQNYQEILNWINGTTNPDNTGKVYQQMQALSPIQKSIYGQRSDLTITQYDNNDIPLLYWKFKDAFPVGLSSPEFSTEVEGNLTYFTAAAEFEFVGYTIVREISIQ